MGTNLREIWIEIEQFSFKKINLKMLFSKWWPYCVNNIPCIENYSVESYWKFICFQPRICSGKCCLYCCPNCCQRNTETERSSGWQPKYSLEMLKLVFNVSCEYQGSHLDSLSISVRDAVYPIKYAHNFVVLCFAVVIITMSPLLLTHWGWDKMAAISQTTFSTAFSWMKIYELRLSFHWNLFLRFELTIFQHWFR